MSILVALLIIVCLICLAVTALAVWFAFKQLDAQLELTEQIQFLESEVTIFCAGVEKVHKMELFYGDIYLKELLDHSRRLVKYLRRELQEQKHLVEINQSIHSDDDESEDEQDDQREIDVDGQASSSSKKD